MAREDRPKKKRTAAQMAKLIERGGQIFELVKGGNSWRKISEELKAEDINTGGTGKGFSFEQCRRVFNDYCEWLQGDGARSLDAWKEVLLARLDAVHQNYEPHTRTFVDDDTPKGLVMLKLKAGDVVVKNTKEMAEILGLKKHNVQLSNPDGTPIGQSIADAFEKAVLKAYDEPSGQNSEGGESPGEADSDG